MPLPSFTRSGAREPMTALDQTQDCLSRIFTELDRHPHVASEILTSISIAASNTSVNHLLGRTPQGWRIVDCTSGWPTVRRVSWSETTITLIASAPCIVNIEVW
jgi:hypothetical protein